MDNSQDMMMQTNALLEQVDEQFASMHEAICSISVKVSKTEEIMERVSGRLDRLLDTGTEMSRQNNDFEAHGDIMEHGVHGRKEDIDAQSKSITEAYGRNSHGNKISEGDRGLLAKL